MPYVDVAAPDMPRGYARAVADRMAARAAVGRDRAADARAAARRRRADSRGGGRAPRPARRSRSPSSSRAIFSTAISPARARRIQDAYEDYSQLRVLRRPLAGVYLSFFLMMTLMILVGATWMGLYLAKRITEPVQRLATAAREIEAGHLDYRVDRETVSDDEFGSLVEAFNSMASEVGKSRRRLERSTVDLERKHVEVEGRRRYIETILERIATGVVSIDATGSVSTLNSAAMRLLGLGPSAVGQPAADVFGREDLQPFGALLRAAGAGKTEPSAQEIALTRDDRELQLAAVATALRGTEGSDGMVLVRRRRDAADPRAESRCLARGGAASRARDQEPADADSVVRRAHAAALQQRAGADAGAGGGMHVDDCRRGRFAEGARGRVLAVRAHAGAARGAD